MSGLGRLQSQWSGGLRRWQGQRLRLSHKELVGFVAGRIRDENGRRALGQAGHADIVGMPTVQPGGMFIRLLHS